MNQFDCGKYQEYWRHHKPKISTFLCGRDAAVAIPLIPSGDDFQVLFEVRSARLDTQPSEVCFPGGGIEGDETPLDAAARELCEELLIEPGQMSVLSQVDGTLGPSGAPMWAFTVKLHDYHGTYSADEVAGVFTVTLSWFMEHDPKVHIVDMVLTPRGDFPYELIPGGREYHWGTRQQEMPFYQYDGHLIWGATARILWHLISRMREM